MYIAEGSNAYQLYIFQFRVFCLEGFPQVYGRGGAAMDEHALAGLNGL
jgi:hypothetical protein